MRILISFFSLSSLLFMPLVLYAGSANFLDSSIPQQSEIHFGYLLIAIGISLMIIEVFISSMGAIGFIGIIAFITGSIILLKIDDANFWLDWKLVALISILTIILLIMIVILAFRSQKKSIVTGREGLIGSEGTVVSLANKQIMVRVLGELWEATSHHKLHDGQLIKVTDIAGLKLTIEPAHKIGE